MKKDLNDKSQGTSKNGENRSNFYKKTYIKHGNAFKTVIMVITILIMINVIFFISQLNQEMPNIEISDKIPNQANAVTDNQTVKNQFEYKECPLCNGYGTVICNNCKGTGHIEVKENKTFNEATINDSKSNNSVYYITCDVCKGKGELICKNCKGNGQIKITN